MVIKEEKKIFFTLGFVLFFCGVLGCIESEETEPDYNMSAFLNSESDYSNSIGMKFVKIPAGDFLMGSSWIEDNRDDDEGPVHEVTIKEPYYLGKFEITQDQWSKIMGNDSSPSYHKGEYFPVESVSWYDAQEFIRKLNQIEKTDKYRLPSEAEWEYACRAGTTTTYSCGNDPYIEKISSEGDCIIITYYDCYAASTNLRPFPVGQMQPNPWGLYDMHGNVREWCQDNYHSSYEGAPTDGSAWENVTIKSRVVRGGSWCDRRWDCRSANREEDSPEGRLDALGFRVLSEI
ncbi:MAG: formylglycine-generating enzyme family protein [Methanosarcina sp.]